MKRFALIIAVGLMCPSPAGAWSRQQCLSSAQICVNNCTIEARSCFSTCRNDQCRAQCNANNHQCIYVSCDSNPCFQLPNE